MTRDELEAVVWQQLTLAGNLAPASRQQRVIVAAILQAADAYAAGDTAEVTALRREILHRETAPASRVQD
jgi:hypothetical protein